MYLIKGTLFCNNVLDKILFFPYAYLQCMSELCFKFQIPIPNTVGRDAETRTVLQGDMVQNICHSRGCNSAIMI